MKKMKLLSVVLLFVSIITQAQDLTQIEKAIDAEQYHKAKSDLKKLITAEADKGKYYFHLANIYILEDGIDSAKIYLEQGILAKTEGHLNYIGLGRLALDKGNATEAKANFDKALQAAKKKSVEELMHIGKAYTHSKNPDYKVADDYFLQALMRNKQVAELHLSIGDAHFKAGNTNEAFRAYREALYLDENLLKAKLQMAVITKNAKAFQEANKAFYEITSIDPNYGPAYRELAETYNFWAVSEPNYYQEYNKKALEHYRKYMSLTDYSLASRMRYADFLILAKDYEALEKEALEIEKQDKTNYRINRYLGYAAYYNGHYKESIEALKHFFEMADESKVIGMDYLYLAKSKLAVTETEEQFDEVASYFKKAVEKDPNQAEELNKLGVDLYKKKEYKHAAIIFSEAVKHEELKTYIYDNYYLGNAILFDAVSTTQKPETEEAKQAWNAWLEKAVNAYSVVIEKSSTTQDAYINQAKIYRLMDTEESLEKAITSYQGYIDVVTAKGETELAKSKVKKDLADAYMYFAARCTNNNDFKQARENFKQALIYAQDEGNKQYITESLEVLKGK